MDTPIRSIRNLRREGGRPWALVITYGTDWLVTMGIAGAFFAVGSVSGFKREFDLNDAAIQHTFVQYERVPNWLLGVICIFAPAILLPIINYATIRSWWDFHTGSLGLVLSLAITGTVTNIIKVTVGRPRPDLIDRCQPMPGSVNHPVYGLSNYHICTQTDAYTLNDGFRSFPSGHSSLSFAGLGFLAWYLAGKLHLFDQRGYTGKTWIAALPLLGAALVAVSRTMDYRHHWGDVTVGSILGLFVSYFAYRQYYHRLDSRNSHLPFAPRIPDESNTLLPLHSDADARIPLQADHSPPVQSSAVPLPIAEDDDFDPRDSRLSGNGRTLPPYRDQEYDSPQ